MAELEPGDETSPDGEAEWRRRRRLAEVFGDTMPDVTTDERDDAAAPAADPAGETAQDRWLRSQVPPHHG